MLKLSLIIPVYNEEHHIGDCLDAISSQTRMPDEVIVVDNNCTDRTVEIAERYKFVKVIQESKQGRGNARSAGFEVATGEILGRIDADSILKPDWTEKVISNFESDTDLDGVTGIGSTDFIPYCSLKTTYYTRSYFWYVHSKFKTITMWGANMAIRKASWERAKEYVNNDDSLVHEDQDLSLCMAKNGDKIIVDSSLVVVAHAQTYRYLPKMIHYYNLYKSTRNIHRENIRNFNNNRLGFFSTLPGRLASLPAQLSMIIVGTIMYPIDFLLIKTGKVDKRLEF